MYWRDSTDTRGGCNIDLPLIRRVDRHPSPRRRASKIHLNAAQVIASLLFALCITSANSYFSSYVTFGLWALTSELRVNEPESLAGLFQETQLIVSR